MREDIWLFGYWHTKLLGVTSLGCYSVATDRVVGAGKVLCWIGGFAALACVLWLESRWRGARKSELVKLPSRLRVLNRVSEAILLVGAKAWLIGVAVVLMGGAFLDELVFGGIGGILCGWMGIGLVLALGRRYGFYCPAEAGQVAERGGREDAELATRPVSQGS